MMKALTLVVFATAALSGFAAQDPVTTLPNAYTKQFENEWVRVVRVHYPPYAKLPAHAHNALPAAYVYLNDGGPVLFKHLGTSYGAATRPATKAGGFRAFAASTKSPQARTRQTSPATSCAWSSRRDATAPSEPMLLIALRDAALRTSDGSKTLLGLGHERWLPGGTAVVFENHGSESSEFLRFDFKTGPVTSSGQR
jgi:hypothetical protein